LFKEPKLGCGRTLRKRLADKEKRGEQGKILNGGDGNRLMGADTWAKQLPLARRRSQERHKKHCKVDSSGLHSGHNIVINRRKRREDSADPYKGRKNAESRKCQIDSREKKDSICSVAVEAPRSKTKEKRHAGISNIIKLKDWGSKNRMSHSASLTSGGEGTEE